jgi:Predicted enzyme involved in methoxymalonyl-ACP biosynthesis
MDKYLKSLEMEGEIFDFRPNDIPRITQLINKSNQFNLTTLRRTESQIVEISRKPDFNSFSIRLRDKFGDYGLISVIITSIKNKILFIDTWIMSCRVLNRQVEYLAMNELVKIARKNKCKEIRGKYLRTKKNSIVKNHYNSLGFDMIKNNRLEEEFELKIASFKPFKTRIQIKDNSIT